MLASSGCILLANHLISSVFSLEGSAPPSGEKMPFFSCETPHSQFSFTFSRSSGGIKVCMHLSMVRTSSASCFEKGRVSVEERTDLCVRLWIVFGISIAPTSGINTQDRQGVGS